MSESANRRNRDMTLNRAKDYYENDKKRLRREARDKYRNLFEEGKIKKGNMGRIDTTICLKIERISKKLLRGKKVSI